MPADGSGPGKPRLIVLVGPTASGKTALALRLAGRFGGEIVSADSLQVYRGMDIGTAKPTPEERGLVPHHLLDVVAPDEPFDASRYCELARAVIGRLHGEGKAVFVVGGTGLYIRALLGGLIDSPPADEEVRGAFKEQLRRHGPERLYAALRERDPQAADRIHPRDWVRIIRALEVLELTGRSIVWHQQAHRFADRPYEALRIGLRPERSSLMAAIDARTDRMIAAGFVEEVRRLLAGGYGRSLKPMQALGYRHLAAHLAGEIGREEAVRLIKRDTRRYARRQLTWFAAEKEILWLDALGAATAEEWIDRFLAGREPQIA